MMEENQAPLAIDVQKVSKSFRLPHDQHSSLKSLVINFARRRKGFEKQEVLKNVTFDVKEGEFFGIVGRNGSGKSTLLKLLAGIYAQDKGGINIIGKLTPFIELGVGFNPELTGRENVYLNGALLGFNRKEMDQMYDDIVKFAELERFMDQKLKNYSSGMQVRLAFSIAIRAESDILLLDEVLAVGDAAFQKKCYDHFMLLKKNKKTVILVTHDMGAVRQYCDRAIMINKGKIVHEGTPDDIAQAYQRLFSDEMSDVSVSSDASTKRWGNKKMRAQPPEVTLTDKALHINVKYVAARDLPAPVLGFNIYGPTGTNILEGNTIRTNHRTEPLRKGQSIEISWTVPNIFATGNYNISVACCDESATEFYDWFNEAASFSVLKQGATAGIVDPKLKVSTQIGD